MKRFDKVFTLTILPVFLLITLGTVVHGTTITSMADPLLSGATVITFDEVSIGTTNPTILGVSFTSSGSPPEVVTTVGNIDTPDLNNHREDVIINFASLVTAFGMDILLADQDVTVWALDASGGILDSATLLSPPGTVANGFLGVGDAGPIASALIDVAPEFIRIDNVHFVSTAIPEPTTMLLLGSGLIGLAGFRRRFKR